MSRVIYNNKIDKIKEFYQKGKTISEIARKFGIERDIVRSHVMAIEKKEAKRD